MGTLRLVTYTAERVTVREGLLATTRYKRSMK